MVTSSTGLRSASPKRWSNNDAPTLTTIERLSGGGLGPRMPESSGGKAGARCSTTSPAIRPRTCADNRCIASVRAVRSRATTVNAAINPSAGTGAAVMPV